MLHIYREWVQGGGYSQVTIESEVRLTHKKTFGKKNPFKYIKDAAEDKYVVCAAIFGTHVSCASAHL